MIRADKAYEALLRRARSVFKWPKYWYIQELHSLRNEKKNGKNVHTGLLSQPDQIEVYIIIVVSVENPDL